MTKMQKFKSWTKKNADNIAVGSFFTLFGAGFIAIAVTAIKNENARIEVEQTEWNELLAHEEEVENTLVDEHNAGNFVYALTDGSYLSVPAGASQRLIK